LTNLSKKELNKRKTYLEFLLNEPRSSDGPSSQEWVSDEYYEGHRAIISKEIKEIDKVLRKLK